MKDHRPKILYLASSWPHGEAFGGQLRALHIGRALQQVGKVTLVVVSSDAGDPEAIRKTGEEFETESAIRPVSSPNRGVKQKLRWAFDPRYLNVHGYVAAAADQARIASYLSRYDLVWVLNSRTPNILQIRDWPRSHLDLDDVPSTYLRAVSQSGATVQERWKTNVQRFLLHRRELLFRQRFATLSVCSREDWLYLGGGDQIHVIPNGFERPVAEPPHHPATSPPRIGFIGLYSYAPNLDGVRWFLEKCWPAIRQAVPGVRFRLAGKDTDGELKPSDPDVDALGWVPNPAAEIATWSAMVIPIRFGGGTRIKIADAFSRKCPVVSTSLGAFGYGVVDGRQLRLADSPEAFSAACLDLIRNPSAGSVMAGRAWHEFLEKWTWDAIAPKVWAAAEDCLTRSSSWPPTVRISSVEDRCATSPNRDRHGSLAAPFPPAPGRAEFEHPGESILVLMPTYNRAPVLAQTLDDITRTDLSGIDLQIVVIDNNCTDNSAECVARFQDRLPVVLLKEPRPGKNCALNKALRESKLRDLVIFVDDDITPKPDWLHEIIAASRRWPNMSAFGAKVRVGWPMGKQPEWAASDWVKIFGFASHDLGDREKAYERYTTPMGPCFWVRKEVFSRVPRFDETIGPRPSNRIMGSEVSFLMRLEQSGFRMAYCPRVQVEHRIQPEECCLPALLKRAYRYGRGEVRLYGTHRAVLRDESRFLWNVTLGADLVTYAGLRLVAGLLAPTKRQRAELALRAMVRVGKISESWSMARASGPGTSAPGLLQK